MFRCLEVWRPIGKDIWLRRVPMEIDKDLNFLCMFFLLSFEVGCDTFEFRKKMIAISILIDVPMSIEIIALHSCSVIAKDDSIDVDHWYEDPSDIIGSVHESIDETLHQPRSNTFSRMLSRHDDCNRIGISMIIA